MKHDVFWVDAFSATPFGGNPAVVCIGTDVFSDTQLQHLANEFNVSESVFISGGDGEYSIRWFTPTKELPLVGHATLAAAHIVLSVLEPDRSQVQFISSISGQLAAYRDQASIAIVLPADDPVACEPPAALIRGLGRTPAVALKGEAAMLKLDQQAQVMGASINMCGPGSAEGLDEIERELTHIELKDEDGEPCANQRFILVFDDGSEQSGFLDADGKADLYLEEGATVRFPGMLDTAKGAAE